MLLFHTVHWKLDSCLFMLNLIWILTCIMYVLLWMALTFKNVGTNAIEIIECIFNGRARLLCILRTRTWNSLFHSRKLAYNHIELTFKLYSDFVCSYFPVRFRIQDMYVRIFLYFWCDLFYRQKTVTCVRICTYLYLSLIHISEPTRPY